MVDLLHQNWNSFGILRIAYASAHVLAWALCIVVLHMEYQRGLPQNYIVRSWWVLELAVAGARYTSTPAYSASSTIEYEVLRGVNLALNVMLAALSCYPNDFPEDVTLPYRLARSNMPPAAALWAFNDDPARSTSVQEPTERVGLAAALLQGHTAGAGSMPDRNGSYGSMGSLPSSYGSHSGLIAGFGRREQMLGGPLPPPPRGSSKSLWEQWLDMERAAGRHHDSVPIRTESANSMDVASAADAAIADLGQAEALLAQETAERQARASAPIPISGGPAADTRRPAITRSGSGLHAPRPEADGGNIRVVMKHFLLPERWSGRVLDAMALEEAVRDAEFQVRVRTDAPRISGGRSSWQLSRRFGHFELLLGALRKRMVALGNEMGISAMAAAAELPDFPALGHFIAAIVDGSSSTPSRTSPVRATDATMQVDDLIRKLRRKLEKFMAETVVNRRLRCQALFDFLEMEGPVVDPKRRLDLDDDAAAARTREARSHSRAAARAIARKERRERKAATAAKKAGGSRSAGGAGVPRPPVPPADDESSDDELLLSASASMAASLDSSGLMMGTSPVDPSAIAAKATAEDGLSETARARAAELAAKLGDKYSSLGKQRKKSAATREKLEKRLEEMELDEKKREHIRERLRRRQLRSARKRLGDRQLSGDRPSASVTALQGAASSPADHAARLSTSLRSVDSASPSAASSDDVPARAAAPVRNTRDADGGSSDSSVAQDDKHTAAVDVKPARSASPEVSGAVIGSFSSEPDYWRAEAGGLGERLADEDDDRARRHSADDADPSAERVVSWEGERAAVSLPAPKPSRQRSGSVEEVVDAADGAAGRAAGGAGGASGSSDDSADDFGYGESLAASATARETQVTTEERDLSPLRVDDHLDFDSSDGEIAPGRRTRRSSTNGVAGARGPSGYLGTETFAGRLALAERIAGCVPDVKGVATSDHTVRLRKLKKCFSGAKAVEWLMDSREAPTREAAVAVMQSLMKDSLVLYAHRLLAGGASRRDVSGGARRSLTITEDGEVPTDFTRFYDSHLHLYQFSSLVLGHAEPAPRREASSGLELSGVRRPSSMAEIDGHGGIGGESLSGRGASEWVMDGIDISVSLDDDASGDDADGTVYYVIKVRCANGSMWALRRRYSEFRQLRSQLKPWLKSKGFDYEDVLPPFPPKRMLALDEAGKEERREGLHEFLRGVCTARMCWCDSLAVFLDPAYEVHVAAMVQAQQTRSNSGAEDEEK